MNQIPVDYQLLFEIIASGRKGRSHCVKNRMYPAADQVVLRLIHAILQPYFLTVVRQARGQIKQLRAVSFEDIIDIIQFSFREKSDLYSGPVMYCCCIDEIEHLFFVF